MNNQCCGLNVCYFICSVSLTLYESIATCTNTLKSSIMELKRSKDSFIFNESCFVNSLHTVMDTLHNRLKVDLYRENEVSKYSYKEHLKIL